MIVGREVERAAIEVVIADAAAGQPGVLGLVGDAGVGKTALLDGVTATGGTAGFVGLVGRPSDSWAGYGGAASLLRQLSTHLDALPTAQRDAVVSCLAPAQGVSIDPLLLGSGLLGLLGEAAIKQPLLVVVDDLQWVDPESRRVIAFALRRLSTERVAVVLACRTSEALPDGVGRVIVMQPLADADALSVARALAPEVDDSGLAEIVGLSAGVPLALVELSRAWQRRTPSRQLPSDVSLDGLWQGELDALSVTARDTLLLAVCDGRIDVAVVVAVLARRSAGTRGLDELVERGLLVTGVDGTRLRHPSLGAAVLASAASDAVRAAHRDIAAELEGPDPARSLWHRAQATVGADDSLAQLLMESARRARDHGRHDEAARDFESAARLTVVSRQRAGALVDAAEEALAASTSSWAARLVERALLETVDDAVLDARVSVLQANVRLRLGWAPELAHAITVASAKLPPDHARKLLVRVLRSSIGERDHLTSAEALAALDRLPGPRTDFQRLARLVLDIRSVGSSVDAAVLLDWKPAPDDLDSLTLLGFTLMDAGFLKQGREMHVRAAVPARASGDVDEITANAAALAFCDHSVSAWSAAYVRALEVAELLADADMPARRCEALLLLAEIDAARGREQDCLDRCDTARRLLVTLADPWLTVLVDRRRALLDLGLGRFDEAALALESALAHCRLHDVHHPYVSPIPDLVEVLVRLGRVPEAEVLAAEFARNAGDAPAAPPRARILRMTGLLAPAGQYDDAFTESVALDVASGLTFHAARTLVLHGERQRRDRRRVEARVRLSGAREMFLRLEATPWVARCDAELKASGAAVASSPQGTISQILTPQELQVAVLVGEGRRNKEIAETLFLSLRTVESHLSRTFRKLGVASRSQLVGLMRDGT